MPNNALQTTLDALGAKWKTFVSKNNPTEKDIPSSKGNAEAKTAAAPVPPTVNPSSNPFDESFQDGLQGEHKEEQEAPENKEQDGLTRLELRAEKIVGHLTQLEAQHLALLKRRVDMLNDSIKLVLKPDPNSSVTDATPDEKRHNNPQRQDEEKLAVKRRLEVFQQLNTTIQEHEPLLSSIQLAKVAIENTLALFLLVDENGTPLISQAIRDEFNLNLDKGESVSEVLLKNLPSLASLTFDDRESLQAGLYNIQQLKLRLWHMLNEVYQLDLSPIQPSSPAASPQPAPSFDGFIDAFVKTRIHRSIETIEICCNMGRIPGMARGIQNVKYKKRDLERSLDNLGREENEQSDYVRTQLLTYQDRWVFVDKPLQSVESDLFDLRMRIALFEMDLAALKENKPLNLDLRHQYFQCKKKIEFEDFVIELVDRLLKPAIDDVLRVPTADATRRENLNALNTRLDAIKMKLVALTSYSAHSQFVDKKDEWLKAMDAKPTAIQISRLLNQLEEDITALNEKRPLGARHDIKGATSSVAGGSHQDMSWFQSHYHRLKYSGYWLVLFAVVAAVVVATAPYSLPIITGSLLVTVLTIALASMASMLTLKIAYWLGGKADKRRAEEHELEMAQPATNPRATPRATQVQARGAEASPANQNQMRSGRLFSQQPDQVQQPEQDEEATTSFCCWK